jgi:outer membrane protein insertion porin family
MRIPIIAFLTLAALAGGELAARAIDPSAAPTEAEFREGTAEIDRRDACPTRAQTEDEVSLTSGTILKNGQDARSTRDELFCGTGILPVHKKLIENGATSQVSPTVRDLPASDELAASKEVRAAQLSPRESPSYRFRLHHNNKIESTVNTQPLSFSTPSQQSTLNSQQSTIIPVQPELISLKSSHHTDFTSLLKTPATLAAKAEIPEAVNSNARQRRGTLQISQAGNAEGVYVAEVKIRFVNSRGEAVDKKGNPVEGRISEDFIRGELKLKPGITTARPLYDRICSSCSNWDCLTRLRFRSKKLAPILMLSTMFKSDRLALLASVPVLVMILALLFLFHIPIELSPETRSGWRWNFSPASEVSSTMSSLSALTLPPEDRLGYSVRAFGDRRISEIFNEDIDLPNGNRVREIRRGGNLRFTRPLGDWQSTLGLNYTNISTRDRNLNIARRDELGNPLTFSGTGVDELYTVSFGAMLDRRDNPFNPTSGSILSLSTEQSIPLGRGNIVSNRLLANYIQYVPVTLLGRLESEALPEMLAFNLQAGTVIGDLPPTEAFRLGGRNSVRSYDSGDIGSGRSYFLASGEYRFPVGRDVGGVIFVDFASDLGTGDSVLGKPAVVRDKPGTGAGVGVGVRVRSRFGLIRLDMGVSDAGEIKFVLGTKQRF